MEELSLEQLLMTLLTDPEGPQSIAFNRHPGGFKVKVAYPDATLKSAGHADADEFTFAAAEFLASLLRPETSPSATPPRKAPAGPPAPPRSDAGQGSQKAKASDRAKAIPEPPAR